jgi:hypothetical protein
LVAYWQFDEVDITTANSCSVPGQILPGNYAYHLERVQKMTGITTQRHQTGSNKLSHFVVVVGDDQMPQAQTTEELENSRIRSIL